MLIFSINKFLIDFLKNNMSIWQKGSQATPSPSYMYLVF
jgi:hypothetical protein